MLDERKHIMLQVIILRALFIYVKPSFMVGLLIIRYYLYPERQRDWPDDARQPIQGANSCKTNTHLLLKDKEKRKK